jgi:hypothetical protein
MTGDEREKQIVDIFRRGKNASTYSGLARSTTRSPLFGIVPSVVTSPPPPPPRKQQDGVSKLDESNLLFVMTSRDFERIYRMNYIARAAGRLRAGWG